MFKWFASLDCKLLKKVVQFVKKIFIFATAKTNKWFVFGELAEWSNAAVLKTVEGHTSGGSNPSLSAKGNAQSKDWAFLGFGLFETLVSEMGKNIK